MWLTNDPAVAKKLKQADKAHDDACERSKGLPLAAKIEALRIAKVAHQRAYDDIAAALP